MKDYKGRIRDYIACEIETLQKLDVDAINDALNLLLETMENGNTVFVFGNGGSSATASGGRTDGTGSGVLYMAERAYNAGGPKRL